MVKLVIEERWSRELRTSVAGAEVVSSALARIEVTRAARVFARAPGAAATWVRTEGDVLAATEALLTGLTLVLIDAGIVERAASLEPTLLRSLDAIHLATALRVDQLQAFVTYDDDLRDAARANGLTVVAPGRDPA